MSELMNVMNGVKKNLDNKYTLGKVYYNDILWMKTQLDELKGSKNPFKRILGQIYTRKLLDIVNSMKEKTNIKPESLLDFAQFYVATHNMVECNYLYGTVSQVLVSDTTEAKRYFCIRVQTSHHKKNAIEVSFKTIPSQEPNITVSVINRDPNGERAVSCERLFLSLEENDEYGAAWRSMCDYIKLVILS